jgi:hypothetical protein
MSCVTNVILCFSCADGGPDTGVIKEVNSFFDLGKVNGLKSIDSTTLPRRWYGGDKMMEANLYVGAFNHLDLPQFVEHLQRLPWRHPEIVQLFVMEENDERFREIKIAMSGFHNMKTE